jgi:hypothetical protein
MFQFPRFPDIIFLDVLYLHELQRNLFSLLHIRQQDHSIHMSDGRVEIRRYSNKMVVMTRWEDEKMLNLEGTSTQA